MEVRGDKFDDGSGVGGGGGASGGGDSTLRTSDGGGAVGRGQWKGLLTIEVGTAENTDKIRLQDTRKLEQWLWYHIRNTECNSIVFLK